jgi:hypothetical protein
VSQVDRSQPLTTSLEPLPAAGGVTQSVRGAKTNGLLLDVTKNTKTELPVSDAVKSQSRTIYEQRDSVVDKSQSAAINIEAPPAAAGVTVTKRGSKTDGNLLDVATDTQTELPVTAAATRNSATVFSTKTAISDKSQSLATSLTPSASGGTIVEKSGSKTPGGLLDVQTETTMELPVTAASIRNRATIFSTQSSVQDKAQSLATSLVASAASGTIVEKSGSKTPGGLLDVQTDTTVEVPVSSARVSGTKTLFSESAAVVDQNQSAATSLVVPAAAGGVVTKKAGSKTPGGLLDVTTETDTEKEVDAASVVKRVTAFRLSVDTENRGKVSAAADPTTPGQTVANSKTPGALYVQRLSTDTPVPVADAGTSKSIDAFSVRTEQAKANQAAKEAEPTTQTPGTIERVSNRLNDLGAWDTDKTLDTATYRRWTTITVDPTGTTIDVHYRNATEAQKDAAIAASSIVVRKTINFTPNAHLLWDGVISTHDSSSFTWSYLVQGKYYTRAHIVHRDNNRYLETYKYTYDEKKNMGVKNGREEYSGAKTGSNFSELAGDWYYYLKVTKVEFNSQDITTGPATLPITAWEQIE